MYKANCKYKRMLQYKKEGEINGIHVSKRSIPKMAYQ